MQKCKISLGFRTWRLCCEWLLGHSTFSSSRLDTYLIPFQVNELKSLVVFPFSYSVRVLNACSFIFLFESPPEKANQERDSASPDPEPLSRLFLLHFLMLPGTFSFKVACNKIGFRIRCNVQNILDLSK